MDATNSNHDQNKDNLLRFQTEAEKNKVNNVIGLTQKEGEEDFVKREADKYNLPYIDLTGLAPEPDALKLIPENLAKEAEIGAFKEVGNKLYIAYFSPNNPKVEAILKNLEAQGLILIKFMTTHASLEHIWSRYADIIVTKTELPGILDINSDILKDMMSHIKTLDDLRNTIITIANGSKNFRISRLIELILSGGLHFKVSDVHIEPEKEKVRVRYRIDGELVDICFLDYETMRLINPRLKLLSGVKLSITQNAQDGRFSIMDNKLEIEVRVSIIPNNYGESFVMRLLDPRNIMSNIESLGMSEGIYEVVERAIAKPNGIILTTGPTGSGKTTTLYAFVNKLYNTETKIITIEDPIEYHIKGIVQTQVEEDKGYTFLSGLRAAMRQDPDIILIGEIRDEDTAKVAINAALTGHLVFSTLHTNNAAGTVPRLLELGANPGTLVSALSLSLAQRLVRKLCPKCKENVMADPKQVKQITNILGLMITNHKETSMENIKPANEYKLYKANPTGCPECTNGYKGRMGVFEAISMTREISDLIINEKVVNERKIRDLANLEGTPTMREDGIIKVLKGETSYEELESVVDLFEE